MAKTVDQYIKNSNAHQETLELLRSIILKTKLKETVKWGIPTYTWEGKNIVGIVSFKSYVGIWFYQGVFLNDPHKLLINAQEGTKAMRSMRFDKESDVDEKIVLSYVQEAIENQKQGKEIKPEKKKLIIPAELKSVLEAQTDMRSAFEALSPGKQKEYAEYIDAAKQEATRHSRIQKIVPMIKSGVGLNDRYKK